MPIRKELLFNVFRIPGSRVLYGSLLLCCAVHVQAAPVSLPRDASALPNVSGYQIYYGQASGDYTINLDAGNQTTYTLDSLQAGKTYYLAIEAYGHDSTGQLIQSDFSNEVSKTIGNRSSTCPCSRWAAGTTLPIANRSN